MLDAMTVTLQVDFMKIVVSKRCVTLWALSLSGIVTCLETFKAEHVIAFG